MLGGGVIADSRLPDVSKLSDASLACTVGGLLMHRQLPGSRLLFSGGKVFEPAKEAELMARLAQELGALPDNLVIEDDSLDTEDQARLIKELVGQERFLLVTSAVHMPRSMALFQKQGLHPVPCPVGHLVKQPQAWSPDQFFPNSGGLRKVEAAAHEYLGLAWAWARGSIQ